MPFLMVVATSARVCHGHWKQSIAPSPCLFVSDTIPNQQDILNSGSKVAGNDFVATRRSYFWQQDHSSARLIVSRQQERYCDYFGMGRAPLFAHSLRGSAIKIGSFNDKGRDGVTIPSPTTSEGDDINIHPTKHAFRKPLHNEFMFI